MSYHHSPLLQKDPKVCVFWCNICDFLNLSIFVRECSASSPGTSHSKERYVTKPQTWHNNMYKTRPRYLNFERFYWESVFARKKNPLYIFPWIRNDGRRVPELGHTLCHILSVYSNSVWRCLPTLWWTCFQAGLPGVGPILNDRTKEKFLKPRKGVICIHFHVYLSACGLQSTTFDLWT